MTSSPAPKTRTSLPRNVKLLGLTSFFNDVSSDKDGFTPASGVLAIAACVFGASRATATSSSQINLSWTASTDNVGVTQYLIESCTGASCSTFTQIGTSTGTTFNNTGLTASTSYSYRVRASDAAGNLSGYSNIATAATSAASQPPNENPIRVTLSPGNVSRTSR